MAEGGETATVMDPGINPVLPDREQSGPHEIEVRVPAPEPSRSEGINPSPSIGSENISPVGRVLGAVRRFLSASASSAPRPKNKPF